MPGRDNTGPVGEGSMTGSKLGDCGDDSKESQPSRPAGWGRGFRRGGGRHGAGFGRGRGRGGRNKPGSGPTGNCVCPSCGHSQSHEPGKPCSEIDCPKCGTRMVRE